MKIPAYRFCLPAIFSIITEEANAADMMQIAAEVTVEACLLKYQTTSMKIHNNTSVQAVWYRVV